MRDVRRIGGGRGLCGGPEKIVDGVFPGRPQRSRHQRRPVDDCSPGRGGMAQNDGTRGGTFLAKWIAAEKARAGLRHTVVCPNMTGRIKKRTPKASGLVLVRSPLLTSHKWREFVSSGRLVCRCQDVFLWFYLCFVLLLFRLHAFVEAAALRSIVLRYAGALIATRVPFFFIYFFRDVTFSKYFLHHIVVFSLYREYVVRSLLPDGVFLPCERAGFFT